MLTKRPKKVFYGWWVIAASTVDAALGSGFYFYGFSALFLPITRDLGLSRAVTSMVFAVGRVEGAVEGPIVGWLIDRFGARALIAVGVILFGIGYMLMSWMNNLLMFFILYAGVVAIGYQTGFVHTKYALANKWFTRQRSKATGIISASSGLGGAILVPVLAWLIIQFGWRTAVLFAGAATMAICLPLLLVIRSTPEDKGLLPDGDEVQTQARTKEGGKPGEATEEVSFEVKEALTTLSFWVLCLAMTMRLFVVGGIWVHMIPLLVFKGFDEQGAANAVALLTLITIPVRIGFGWLGDHFSKRYLLMLCCFIETGALLILLTAQSLWQVYLFVIVFALGYGVAPLNVSIVGEYFGRKNFATIRGIMALLYAAGIVSGPIFAGYIYDVTNSYHIAFVTFIFIYSTAALIYVFARPPRPPATKPATSS
ncbi:MAG: MFS transporter [Chloroflexota bacterium]